MKIKRKKNSDADSKGSALKAGKITRRRQPVTSPSTMPPIKDPPDPASAMDLDQNMSTSPHTPPDGTDSSHKDLTSQSQQPRVSNNKIKIQEGTELYKHTDDGPYYVIAEQKLIDALWLGQTLLKTFKIKNILNLNKISKEKVRIQVKDFHNANQIIKLADFDRFKDIKFYIPKNFVFIDGIIKDIPTNIQLKEIHDELVSKIPIEQIERLDYWDRNTNSLRPSTTIKLTFRSCNIPDQVYLYLVPNRVELYIQKPLFCQACLSYGHTKKYCHTERPLCRTCTEPVHDTDTRCKPTCKDCSISDPNNNGHLTATFKCPAFKIQREVKRIMILKRLTFKEAHREYLNLNPTPNRQYHPPQPPPSSQTNSINKSYADITKNPRPPDRHESLIHKLINIMNSCTSQGVNSDLIVKAIGNTLHEYSINNVSSEHSSATDRSIPGTSGAYLEPRQKSILHNE